MDERLAFLRAIRAQPDDDTVRLVFADWLDEHDDPLGELIRVQIELEPIRYRIDNPRARELHKREDELLRAHGDDWITTNHLLTHTSDEGPVFRRGLPDYACLSLDTFLNNGEALFAAYPTLREVALYGVANRCDELTLSPLLANLETLEIADWPTEDDAAAALSASPYLVEIPNFKLWVGGEMPLLRELVRQADTPRKIELVQVYGGAACFSPDLALELNDAAESLAREANRQLGRTVVRVTRPFERLLPLDGDLEYNLSAGHLPDGSPALAAGSFGHWILVTFNGDGRVQDVSVRDSPIPRPALSSGYGEAVLELESAFTEWVDGQLELELGLIWVREFDVEDLSIVLWPWHLRERSSDPSPHPPRAGESETYWREQGGEVRGWLERRDFVINWGNDYHADWRGKIHSS